jgi:molecular chaperone GrpE
MAKKKGQQGEEPVEEVAGEVTESAAETDTAPKKDPRDEELAAEKEKYLRLLAEYDNFRKRSQKERENIYADVRCDTVSRFLPVYDNLSRALNHETADDAYKKGIEMTLNQMCEVFHKLGVTEIEAEGQPFDPTFHNAVMHIEDESIGEGIIVEEFQKGFKMGDKVIRFSMVKVAN